MTRREPDYATGKLVDVSKPEEQVRQEFERVLVESYGYRKPELDIEVRIPRGSGYFPDKADIVIYRGSQGRDPARHIVGIVETKRPTRKDGLAQLKSYMTATSAEWGVWTNRSDIAFVCRHGTQIRDDFLHNLPVRGQSVTDVGRLTKADLRPFGRQELTAAFRRILLTLYANTTISRREKLGSEMIKLIFAKIEDEKTYVDSPPEFRAEAGESHALVARRIAGLFHRVRDQLEHDGIFTSHEGITLDDRSVAWVVGQLERGSLLQTDSDVVGDAFEVFSESKFVGEKGEFFTPRGVVRLAVKLAKPRPGDIVCDPACGSGGFLIHAMRYLWEAMTTDPRWKGSPTLSESQRQLAAQSLFGIDKETDLVKIAKAHMAIAGDGRSNIVHENTLHDPSEYGPDATRHFVQDGDLRRFDVVLTNPPYGTKAKVLAEDSASFLLGHAVSLGDDGVWRTKGNAVKRDPYVLFVERCLEMLKTGGVLGIVLPETVFHAPRMAYLREFIMHGNSIEAVVSLPHNTFRPYCNAKTCLLILRKGVEQHTDVLMATPQEMGHDHNGRPLERPGTNELWDDLQELLDEIDIPYNPANEHCFVVDWSDIDRSVLIPKFYRRQLAPADLPADRVGVRLGELVSEGLVSAWDGHGSPTAQEKGAGDIPYIRVSDIVNWELYRNPVTGIPQEAYRRLIGAKPPPQEGDVIFVRRGSYRIGTVAMASPRDADNLLTRELLTLRVAEADNARGLSPFYLLALLSSDIVQEQIDSYVFVDTTLPNIGGRWRHLVLPFHRDSEEACRVSEEVEASIRAKWAAQDHIDALRARIGGLVT